MNECYLRLIDARTIAWQDRAHFFALSARLMRRILVDFARSRQSGKRGAGVEHTPFDERLASASFFVPVVVPHGATQCFIGLSKNSGEAGEENPVPAHVDERQKLAYQLEIKCRHLGS